MDHPTPLIRDVAFLEAPKLIIEASDGNRYHADLSDFKSVFCFPTDEEWSKGAPDSQGIAIIWPGRFEIHVDQLVGVAHQVEPISEAAMG